MPFFAQRYRPDYETVSYAGTNSANADTEKMWPLPSHYAYFNATHVVTRAADAGAPYPTAAHHSRPSATHQHQYGGQGHYTAASGYARLDGRDGSAIAQHERVGGWQYGADAEYGGHVQGTQGYGWRQTRDGAYGYDQALYPAASTGKQYDQQQGFHRQGQEQQYAQSGYFPPYDQPYGQYHGHNAGVDQGMLMQQWHAANALASNFNASAQAFTPISAQPAPSAQQWQQQPLQSVSEAKLNQRSRVDKQSRYEQQPLTDAKHFDQSYFDPAVAPQMVQVPPPPPAKKNEAEWYASMGMRSLAAKARRNEAKRPGKGNKQILMKLSPAASAVQTPSQLPPRRSHRILNGSRKRANPAYELPVRTTLKPPSTQGFDPCLFNPDSHPQKALSPPRSPKPSHPQLLKRPEPAWSYMKQAQHAIIQLDTGKTRPLLIVLDLNGTLLYRNCRGGNNFVARPRVSEFLHYLLTNHKVLIWSSARPDNVAAMVEKLFTPEQRAKLVGVWARDKLRLSEAHFNARVQVFKQLSWVWRDDEIAPSCVGGEEWGQENTVMIDDSEEKAASEPFNLLKIDEFEGTMEQMETDVLGQVVEYLDVLKGVRDVSACMRASSYYFRPEEVAFDWMPVVNDMH